MDEQALKCNVCGAMNSSHVTRCDCGAFLVNRVPALNLFATLWGMIEQPAATLLRVSRSEQKNYTFLLFAGTGPALLYAMFLVIQPGDRGLNFGSLILLFIFVAPVAGVLHGVIAAVMLKVLCGIRRQVLRFRDAAAGLAWPLSPLLWISVLILPLKFGIFGMTLFSGNPPAHEYQPLSYCLLAIVEIAAVVWSIGLLLRRTAILGNVAGIQTLTVVILALVIIYAPILFIVIS